MKKMIIAATLLASVALSTTIAFAHRPAQVLQQPAAKADFAKTLFDRLERYGR